MTTSLKLVVAALAAMALSGAAWSQGRGNAQFTVNTDGTIVISHQTVPLPAVLSDDAKKVLNRNTASEGPGAPVPTPDQIKDMTELRRVYNENLQPNVNHMRQVFPVDIEETTMDGISVAIVTPKDGVPEKNKNRAILNAPGGGYRTGVRANGLLISIPMAATLGVKVYTILYRQSPEYTFPAGEEDMLKVWNVLTKTYKPENMGMVGCSAGSGMVAHTTTMLLMKGQPAPAVIGLYCGGMASAQGDSAFTSALAITNIPAAVAAAGTNIAGGTPAGQRGYFDGVDMNQPALNPAKDPAIMAKWPPTIFLTGTRDFAMSTAIYSARQVALAGQDTRLLVYDGLYHGFMTNPDFPESQEAYKICAAFFDKHMGR